MPITRKDRILWRQNNLPSVSRILGRVASLGMETATIIIEEKKADFLCFMICKEVILILDAI